MCGIAGFFSDTSSLDRAQLEQMTNAMAHRGPDAAGFYYQNNIGLGHRRLSIIDLREVSNQPMYDSTGRYCMVFNGEVYNFKEIAEELEVPLKTTSDTEVVLEAFVKWGPDFVNRLNGMFALAIYDTQQHELFLFRDRMGIKPLFYCQFDDMVVFASEIKGLLELDVVQQHKAINKKALRNYLNLGYIPDTDSIFEGINKLPQGSYAKLSKGSQVQPQVYWKLEDQVKGETIKDETVAKAQLKELIESSVNYRLMADVPFGTFLSGGIDSSLVTSAAQAVSSVPVNTFSIGFEEAQFNESEHARKVAEHLGTKHHEFIVSHKEAIELFEDIVDVHDEPFADSSSVPTMLVSRLARQEVTMTLSGDGGDETYMGYGFYNWAKRLSNPLVKALRQPIGAGLSMLSSRYERASHLFKYSDASKMKSHIFSQEQYCFADYELDDLLTNDYKGKPDLNENFEGLSRKLSEIEEQALFDMKYYLPDDLLVKVDRASMRYSLETRVPLLDHRLVAFALNVDDSLKLNDKTFKYLLKEVLFDYVPREYFERPKWGFGMPINQWLNKELKHLVDDFLSEEVVQKAGIVNYKYVQGLKQQYFAGKNYLYNRIWILVILHRWYLKHFS